MLGQAVAAAATRLGHDVIALSRAELDVTDADHVRRVVAAAEPRAVVNCAAWTDVDGAETAEAAATAVNGDGAGNVAARRRPRPARASCTSRPTTSSTAPSASRGSSPTRSPRSAPTGARSSPASAQVAAATGEHAIVRTRLALRRRRAQLRRHDARAGRGARRGERRHRPGRQPDVDRAPRRGARRARRAPRRHRDPARDRRRRLLVVRARGRGLRRAPACAAACCRPRPTASRGPRGGRRTPCSAPSATTAPVLPPWQDGVAAYLSEKAVVAG